MNEILIQDLTGHELRFRGDLILESEKSIDLDDEHVRSVTVRVYAVKGGGFVPMMEYATSCPDENAILTFENVDCMKDVECFFFVFEATEVLGDPLKLPRQQGNQRATLGQRFARQFESLIFPFLDEVRETADALGYHDKPEEKKPSLWNLLG
jgi:hypothetical protein